MIRLIDRLELLEKVYLKFLIPVLGCLMIIFTISVRSQQDQRLRHEVFTSIGTLLEEHLVRKDLISTYRTVSSFEKTVNGLKICLKDSRERIIYGERCSSKFSKLNFKIYDFAYFISVTTSPYSNITYELGFIIIAILLMYFLAKNLNRTIKILKNDFSMIQVLNQKDTMSHEGFIISKKLQERQELQNRINILEKEESHAKELRSIAHDLRSPLTVLKYLTEDLSEELDKKRAIGHAIRRSEDICQSLLDRSRQVKQPENSSLILKSFCQSKELEHKNKKLKINLTLCREEILIDQRWHQIERILSNLINNAVESYNTQTQAIVDLEFKRSGEWLCLRVKDYGGGIISDARENLFKLNFSTKKEGNGIGLFQAKSYIESIGGKIECLPHEIGTTFQFSYPSNVQDIILN